MSFVSLAIHRPKAGKEEALCEVMRRFAVPARGQPGLERIFTLRSRQGDALIGLAIWESEAAMDAIRPAMRAAIADVDFSELEDGEGFEFFYLDEA